MKEEIERNIVRAYVDGMPIKDIEVKFDTNRVSIYSYLKRYGVEPNRSKISEELKQELLELYNSGIKLKDINSKYDKHVDGTIYRYTKGNRIQCLNEEQQEFIKNNVDKMKQKDIAKSLGVTSATITYYKNKIK